MFAKQQSVMSKGKYLPLIDSYGRRINHLRISLTDECNFRCVYCMPYEGLPEIPKEKHLSVEEICRFVKIVGRRGIGKIKLSGGEPLLRKDVCTVIQELKKISTVEDLSITTNASVLSRMVVDLKNAGLDRINVSLDSLDAKRFNKITRSHSYVHVIKGIRAAMDVGFSMKVNMVVMQGVSDEDLLELAQLALDYPMDVRFIEFMPLCGSGWRPQWVKPILEVKELLNNNFKIQSTKSRVGAAEEFHLINGKGKIGFIASLTEPFCGSCSRIRLAADGSIRPCLFSEISISVKEELLLGSDLDVMKKINEAVRLKPAGNVFYKKKFDGDIQISGTDFPLIRSIGG